MRKHKSDLLLGCTTGLVLAGALWSPAVRTSPVPGTAAVADVATVPSGTAGAAHASPWAARDWEIFSRKVRWALSEGLDTLPVGEAMARLGRSFVGTPYAAGTLEQPGPEHLVIDFHSFDCVTFVETVFATTRFLHYPEAHHLDRRAAAEARYDRILTRIRYRGGTIDGYPSRLNYFSEWISDGEAKGLVKNVTRALGGVRDTGAIDFMTTHVRAYRQLADPANVAAMRKVEARLSREPRWFIPQDRIAAAAPGIRAGDIIAATSTVPGLDVAHTGLAVWVHGKLHLLSAPDVGTTVRISREPLAERIQGLHSEDGIMVARPLPVVTRRRP